MTLPALVFGLLVGASITAGAKPKAPKPVDPPVIRGNCYSCEEMQCVRSFAGYGACSVANHRGKLSCSVNGDCFDDGSVGPVTVSH